MTTAVLTSRNLKKSGGIQTVTQTLFKDIYPIYFLEEASFEELVEYERFIFSGFDMSFVDIAQKLKRAGKKISVFWHFGAAHEVDPDLGEAWKSVLRMQKEHVFDLFISFKYGLCPVIEKLFKIPTFFIENNSMACGYKDTAKEGIGIYSGSSDYWVKNLRPNLYAALMTGMHVDILPYEDSLKDTVEMLGLTENVTGASRLSHDEFMKRMCSRELVTYVTFAEGAPILPLEALNNGTLCITGDNHQYWMSDTRLHDLLVCTRPDDPFAIYQSIQKALDNKDEILQRYDMWKAEHDKLQRENFAKLQETIENL